MTSELCLRPLSNDGRFIFQSNVRVDNCPWKESPLMSRGVTDPVPMLKSSDMLVMEDMDDEALPVAGDSQMGGHSTIPDGHRRSRGT